MQVASSKSNAVWRRKGALLVLMLWICGTFVLDTKWSAPINRIQSTAIGKDERTLYFKRFDALQGAWKWPDTLGYIDDSPTDDWFQDHLFSTRFALAPIMVEKGIDYEYVIGNFHPPTWMTHEVLL